MTLRELVEEAVIAYMRQRGVWDVDGKEDDEALLAGIAAHVNDRLCETPPDQVPPELERLRFKDLEEYQDFVIFASLYAFDDLVRRRVITIEAEDGSFRHRGPFKTNPDEHMTLLLVEGGVVVPT